MGHIKSGLLSQLISRSIYLGESLSLSSLLFRDEFGFCFSVGRFFLEGVVMNLGRVGLGA